MRNEEQSEGAESMVSRSSVSFRINDRDPIVESWVLKFNRTNGAIPGAEETNVKLGEILK
jgi:hypothetical protein